MRFASRLAITLAVPLLLLVLGEHLALPGIPADLVDGAGSSRNSLGVFALGIQPVLSAYWVVEVVAFLVPRWSRLRHGNPEGREKLDRAVRFAALALAAVQAFAMALSLSALGSETEGSTGFSISVPMVMASLVAGVSVQFVAASLISRQGLVNGFVALAGAGLFRGFVEGVAKTLGGAQRAALEPLHLGVDTLDVLVAIAATWIAVRGAGSAPSGLGPLPGSGMPATTEEGASSSPYRTARWLVVHPWIPVPSSSFQAYYAAAALLVLPVTLTKLGLPLSGVATFLERGDAASIVTLIALTGGAMVLLARLMHRPAEMADLASRLGAANGKKLLAEAREALRRTLVPSFLFFLAIILSSSPFSVLSAASLTVIVMDLAHALRTEQRAPGLVSVWEERRASAVPVLRAALAADGIPTETRGMAVLSFWQVFAPYAPLQLLVKPADAERATRTLRHLLMGEAAPEPTEASLWRVPVDSWTLSRRTAALAACAAAAGLLAILGGIPPGPSGLIRPPEPRSASERGARAKLEVVRVDDTIDPFVAVRDEDIPDGQGIAVYQENVRVGPDGKTALAHYARVVLREGETKTAAMARVRPWFAAIPLPRGARFGFEDIVDYDPDTGKASVIGFRTFVLVDDSVLHTGDVTEAVATLDSSERALGTAFVSITLSPDGAKRFEDVTRTWTGRRLAIVIDDEINSAPVIRAAVPGGHLQLTMGSGDPEQKLFQAKELAWKLGGR